MLSFYADSFEPGLNAPVSRRSGSRTPRAASRSARMRALFALLALLLLATFAPLAPQRPEPPPAVSLVWAEAVPLDPSWPERRTVGRLRFLGGWRLTSNDSRFGGISAMHVEGGTVLAFSDSGWKIEFPLPGTRSPVKA